MLKMINPYSENCFVLLWCYFFFSFLGKVYLWKFSPCLSWANADLGQDRRERSAARRPSGGRDADAWMGVETGQEGLGSVLSRFPSYLRPSSGYLRQQWNFSLLNNISSKVSCFQRILISFVYKSIICV